MYLVVQTFKLIALRKTGNPITIKAELIQSSQCYCKIRVLDVNPSPISFLDDTLLFVCLPAHFVFAFVNVMPAVFVPGTAHEAVQIVKNALMVSCTMMTLTCTIWIHLQNPSWSNLMSRQVVQVLVQTPMIVDGLRRCSDSAENQRARPGRQLITFLIASNLAMYVWDTFELKSYELQVGFMT